MADSLSNERLKRGDDKELGIERYISTEKGMRHLSDLTFLVEKSASTK